MLSHDQMVFAITQLYPDLVHGQDFWVAHPVVHGSCKQIGAAEIIAWPQDIPPPDCETLQQIFDQHAAVFYAQCARQTRNAALRASDWTQMPDSPAATHQAWTTYRQALREVSQQPGFPQHIDWPTPPHAL